MGGSDDNVFEQPFFLFCGCEICPYKDFLVDTTLIIRGHGRVVKATDSVYLLDASHPEIAGSSRGNDRSLRRIKIVLTWLSVERQITKLGLSIIARAVAVKVATHRSTQCQ